tara:strand:+ start:334 stop:654 length:321 start_codon:yes stop_codon:yes gene_type:complete
MSDRKLGQHTFVFNKKDNGGEHLSLHTTFYDNGDSKIGLPPEQCIYTVQELTLQSYCNSVVLNLHGASITPQILRDLANELDEKTSAIRAAILAEQAKLPKAVDDE